jgi:hypothetical protein
MSIAYYVDIQFVSRISFRLRNFKDKGSGVWNFSCNYCGDSTKQKNKARGYLYTTKGTLLYRCHKCGKSTTFSNFLKELDPLLHNEYILEKYKSNATHPHVPKLEFPKPSRTLDLKTKSPLDELYKLSELSKTHPAVQYVAKRLIPEEHWDKLYFCAKYIEWCKRHNDKEIKIDKDTPRLVIPTYNQNGDLIGWSGRAFGAEFLRYHIVKLTDDALIYGLERVDITKTINVVEGQLDSLFLTNCIATGGVSSFDTIFTREHKDVVVLIIDNEPRNLQIVKTLEKYINLGYSVCLFPENIVGKDINEMILAKTTPTELEQIILDNTVKGVSATLKLASWRKV